MKDSVEFLAIVHAALARTRVPDLLASKAAVVLERIARGGGATEWYYCRGTAELGAVEGKLSPGSVVSFYFDERIRSASYSPQLGTDIAKVIDDTGDAVVGVLGEDGIEIHVDIVVSGDDLAEVMAATSPASRVFYGSFPSRDDDGMRAVTVTLPDRDGIVRGHPH